MPRTLDYLTVNLNPRQSAPYDHNARPSQTDRQTDRRTDGRTNIMAIAWRFVLWTHRALKTVERLRHLFSIFANFVVAGYLLRGCLFDW